MRADELREHLRIGIVSATRTEADIDAERPPGIEVAHRIGRGDRRAGKPREQERECRAHEPAHAASRQVCAANSTTRASLCRSTDSVTRTPLVALVENPHCGLIASCSS